MSVEDGLIYIVKNKETERRINRLKLFNKKFLNKIKFKDGVYSITVKYNNKYYSAQGDISIGARQEDIDYLKKELLKGLIGYMDSDSAGGSSQLAGDKQ